MNPKTLRDILTAVLATTPQAVHLHRADGTLTALCNGAVYVAGSMPSDGCDFAVQIDRTKALMAALRNPTADAITSDGTTLVVSGKGWRVGVPCAPSTETPKAPPPMVLLPDSVLAPTVALPGDDNRHGLNVLRVEEHRTVATDGARLGYADTTTTNRAADSASDCTADSYTERNTDCDADSYPAVISVAFAKSRIHP